MSNNDFCIIPESDDSDIFGHSIVINHRFLAIADVIANRVVVYTPNNSGQWIRTKEIYPPENFINSSLGEHGPRFGENVELNGDTLIITANKMLPITSKGDRPPSRYDFWAACVHKRYSIQLNAKSEVSEIELRRKKTDKTIEFNLLQNGKIEKIVIPNNGEERFGESVAIHQNWLIVGSPSHNKRGKALIYNLNKPKAKPSTIEVEDDNFGETVAISKSFAVANGCRRAWGQSTFFSEWYPGKIKNTLIRNLKTDITTRLDSYGHLSISNNILAVMHPGYYCGDFYPLLEVFEIDENNTVKLLVRREDVSTAWVQNGYLVTVKHPHDLSIRTNRVYSCVCIESIQ